jgi:chlorophyllide a oxygenase
MLAPMGAGAVPSLRAAAARRRASHAAAASSPRCAAAPGRGGPEDPERDMRKFWFLRKPQTAPEQSTRLLGELAMLNERLSGGKPHEVRLRVEWLQRRRRNWELIYQYVTRTDAAVTLSLIEAANAKARASWASHIGGCAARARPCDCARRAGAPHARRIRALAAPRRAPRGARRRTGLTHAGPCASRQAAEALSSQARESTIVSDLVAQLQALQAQVAEAHERVADMVRRRAARQPGSPAPGAHPGAPHARAPPPPPQEDRVSANLLRVRQLEAEARSLDALAVASGAAPAPALALAAAPAEPDECDVTSPFSATCLDAIEPPAAAPRAAPARKGMSARFADAASLATPTPDTLLRHHWHPVTFLSKARDGEELTAFDEQWTIRAAPGAGCGWTVFARATPSGPIRELPTAVMDGMLAVWPGANAPTAPPPQGALLAPKGYQLHAEIIVEDVPVEHGLLLENLLDLAHAPFTHTGTFAKGWGVPDIVQFAAAAARAPGDGWADMGNWLAGGARGNWAPYPIDMSFEPPCCVISHIGLAQAGAAGSGAQFVAGSRAADCPKHLHQLHVCLPSREGRTRLLYRMHLDFASWAALVPGMHLVWSEMAAQVLGEDLRLVTGQQERLARGIRVWGHPVAYDKCGLAYRRFRNFAAQTVPPEHALAPAAAPPPQQQHAPAAQAQQPAGSELVATGR